MKNTNVLYVLDAAYGQIFVDNAANFIHFIHENDGRYQSEYFDALIAHFGGRMRELDVSEITDNDDCNQDDPEEFVKEHVNLICELIAKAEKSGRR